MLLAVDPDVLALAERKNLQCLVTVINLDARAEIQDVLFAVDDKTIKREYATLLARCTRSGSAHDDPLVHLLRLALGLRKQRVGSCPSPKLQAFLQNTPGCRSPVEPELLGMAEKEKSLCLLLVGDESGLLGARPRGLADPKIRRAVESCIGALDVRFAMDMPVSTEPFCDKPPKGTLELWFEDRVALYLQKEDQKLHCVPSPEDIPALAGDNEKPIDIYGFRKDKSGDTLVIGECKLPIQGNEDHRLILSKDIRQVLRQLMAAAMYEIQRGHSLSGLEAIIASTAGDFWDAERILIEGAENYLNQEYCRSEPSPGNAFPLRFMKVTLRQKLLRKNILSIVNVYTWQTWQISSTREQNGTKWRVTAVRA